MADTYAAALGKKLAVEELMPLILKLEQRIKELEDRIDSNFLIQPR